MKSIIGAGSSNPGRYWAVSSRLNEQTAIPPGSLLIKFCHEELWPTLLISVCRRQRKDYLCKFKASLVYLESSVPAWWQSKAMSQNNHNNNNNKSSMWLNQYFCNIKKKPEEFNYKENFKTRKRRISKWKIKASFIKNHSFTLDSMQN